MSKFHQMMSKPPSQCCTKELKRQVRVVPDLLLVIFPTMAQCPQTELGCACFLSSLFVVQPSLPVQQLAVIPHRREGPYMGQAGSNSCYCALTPPPVCFVGPPHAKKAKLGFLAALAEKCLIPGVLAWLRGKAPIAYCIWQASNLCPHSEPCVCPGWETVSGWREKATVWHWPSS